MIRWRSHSRGRKSGKEENEKGGRDCCQVLTDETGNVIFTHHVICGHSQVWLSSI